jgi:hypothetical protein
MTLPCRGGSVTELSVTENCHWRGGDEATMPQCKSHLLVNIAHSPKFNAFPRSEITPGSKGAASGRCACWPDARLTAGTLNGMGVQPTLVLEKRSKQQRDMPMVISFGARRERAGIAQKVAPMLNKVSLAVERLFRRQFTSSRRHGSHLCRSPGDADDTQACHSGFPSRGQYCSHSPI